MLRARTLGLAFVAVFAMSAVATSSASAAFKKVWEVSECVKVPAGTGKYEESKCKKEGGKKEWEIKWKEVGATPIAVTSAGKLKLNSGGTEVECEGTNTGTVGEKGKDEIITITVTNCKIVKAGFCEELIKVEPLNLPWLTQLVEVGGKLKNEIKPHAGGKNPGWAVTCKTFLGNKTVKCTAPKAQTLVTNNIPNDTVETEFNAETENASCEGGTSSEGTVRGIITIKAASGAWLRAV
jgi:hypothetical protein